MTKITKKLKTFLLAPILYKILVDIFALSLIGSFIFMFGAMLLPDILTAHLPTAFVLCVVVASLLTLTFVGAIQNHSMKKSFSFALWVIVFVCATQFLLLALLPMTSWALLTTLFFALVLLYLFLTELLHF